MSSDVFCPNGRHSRTNNRAEALKDSCAPTRAFVGAWSLVLQYDEEVT
jgi:hypothetical protein